MFHLNIIHLCLDPSVVSSLQAATKKSVCISYFSHSQLLPISLVLPDLITLTISGEVQTS